MLCLMYFLMFLQCTRRPLVRKSQDKKHIQKWHRQSQQRKALRCKALMLKTSWLKVIGNEQNGQLFIFKCWHIIKQQCVPKALHNADARFVPVHFGQEWPLCFHYSNVNCHSRWLVATVDSILSWYYLTYQRCRSNGNFDSVSFLPFLSSWQDLNTEGLLLN